MTAETQTADFLRTVLDAFPTPVFVVDDTMDVVDMNTAAKGLYEAQLRTRTGKILHCIHVEKDHAECGESRCCNDCIVQNAAQMAIGGQRVTRRRSKMQIVQNGETKDIHLLVTTAPFQHDGRNLALLILEDMTEIIELKALIPICAGCKKVRNDEDYWEHVESYLHRHLDVDFTHGLCPSCIERLYPQVKEASSASE